MAVGYCRPQSIFVFVILKLPMGRITADLLFLVHFRAQQQHLATAPLYVSLIASTLIARST